MMETLLFAMLHILVHPAAVFADLSHSGACRDSREEFGFALLGHDFKSVQADNFARCFFECSLEEICQSVRFLFNKKECKFNNETKKSQPKDFVENPAAAYMENNFRAKKGSKSLIPGSSCKDILISGDAQGDGEYWIDPTASGDPFTVFCDMLTDGGGWTLISRFLMKDLNSQQDAVVESISYRNILPNYSSNNQYLMRGGFNQLKIDMGFTQIRFHCFKKNRGRVLHIMTNKNWKSDTLPKACGSFTRLPDDNSALARNCVKWGYPSSDQWASAINLYNKRLYRRPIVWSNKHYFRFLQDYDCDDHGKSVSLGDIWQIFVR